MDRAINDCNSLPTSGVEKYSINTFKSLLDNYLLDFFRFSLSNTLIGYTGFAFTRT